MNQEYFGIISDSTRWLYFLVIALALYRAFTIYGTDAILRCLLVALSTMPILQVISIGIGKADPSEFDGSVSYTGGYGHEGNYSLILFTLLCASVFVRWKRWGTPLAMALLCVLGILFANYRTTILAVLPIIAMLISTTAVRWTLPLLRPVVFLATAVALIAAGWFAWDYMPARFNDIAVAVQSFDELVKPPYLYTWAEREIFNARAFIWAQYIYAWWNGSMLEQLFGFGPEAYRGVFDVNAHNTFVTYLYEGGLIGLSLLVLMFTIQIGVTLMAADRFVGFKLAACMVGFVLLNFASVPLWSIEGLIAFAVLCALSWAYAGNRGLERPPEPSTPRQARRIGSRWRSHGAAVHLRR